MDNEIQENIAIALSSLGKALTVFHRNVKVLHWNYKDKDFVLVHPWLDEVADCINSCIDTVYEQLRKYNLKFDASLTAQDLCSNIQALASDKTFNHEETFNHLSVEIDIIRVLLDKNATLAEQNKLFTYHDSMVQMNSKLDHIRYFVTNSL